MLFRSVQATSDMACAYKINSAPYEAAGAAGLRAMQGTIRCIHEQAPGVPVILDYKRGDTGHTNAGYSSSAFDFLKADAVTVNPYMGYVSLEPFISQTDKGVIVLCRTSNLGAGEFQDQMVAVAYRDADRWEIPRCTPMPFYQLVAYRVSREWNRSGNCVVVVGATCPEELAIVRNIVGDMPILIPAIGAQGGDVEKTVRAGKDRFGQGIILSSSRSVIYASSGSDFAEAARAEVDALTKQVRICVGTRPMARQGA